MDKRQNWYFTFGSNHAHPNGYIKIYGTFGEARSKMFEEYGAKWAFQYDEEQFIPQIARFNLQEV